VPPTSASSTTGTRRRGEAGARASIGTSVRPTATSRSVSQPSAARCRCTAIARSCGIPHTGRNPRSASAPPKTSAAAAWSVERSTPARLVSRSRPEGARTAYETISHATSAKPTVTAAAAGHTTASESWAIPAASTGPAHRNGSANGPRHRDASLRSSVGSTCSTPPVTASGRKPSATRCTASSTSSEARPPSARSRAARSSTTAAALQARSAATKYPATTRDEAGLPTRGPPVAATPRSYEARLR